MNFRKRILFYIKTYPRIQGFHRIDIDIMEKLGYEVVVTTKIRDFIKWWSYDISFVYFYTWGLFVAIISRLFLKNIYFTGGIDNLNKNTADSKKFIIQKVFFKLCRIFATRCIIVSDSDMANVVNIYGSKKPKKLELSYHVVNVEQLFEPNLHRNNNFVTICWMKFVDNVKRKGVDKSLRLFKYLSQKKEFKNSIFYIIGQKGEGTLYLEELANELGVLNKVCFLGEISEEEKVNCLKSNKYYLQLSYYEGFGLAALEALSACDIVVHSGEGGLKYSIGRFGIEVNIDDLEQEFSAVYNKLLAFDIDILYDAHELICNRFSYNKRIEDFQRIIK